MPPPLPENCHPPIIDHPPPLAPIVPLRKPKVPPDATAPSSAFRKSLPDASSSSGHRSSGNGLLCLCCFRRPPGKDPFPSPPPSVRGAAPVMVEEGQQQRETVPVIELSALQLADQEEKSHGGFFLFHRRHRSLSSQKRHKKRTKSASKNGDVALPMDALRSLDADSEADNRRDYLDVERAQGGWMRDADFWPRQQAFWRKRNDADAAVAGDASYRTTQSEVMETARTSRVEDIDHYPSMDTLIDEILLADDASGADDDEETKQYFRRTTPLPARASGRSTRNDGTVQLEAVVTHTPATAVPSSSASSQCRPAQPPPASPSAFPPPVFYNSVVFTVEGAAVSGGTLPEAATTQTQLARVPATRAGGVQALKHSVWEAVTLTYVWLASSLAFLIQWFL